jgi:hypothetical protein
MAVRRGLRGVTAGILALNFGMIVLLRIYPQDNQQLAGIQFLMLILSLTGLVLGAVISERDRSEHRLAEEEEHIRLLDCRPQQPERLGNRITGWKLFPRARLLARRDSRTI